MRSALTLTVLLVFGVCETPHSWAATFTFDLSSLVGDDLTSQFREAEVDLGLEFDHITSARFRVVGTFHPGKMKAVGPEPNTNPLVPTDTVTATVRVGEVGTAFTEKELVGFDSLIGQEGNMQLDFLLSETEDVSLPILHLNPSLVPASNFDSLLDGKFGFSSYTLHIAASLYQVIENPRLEVASLTLQIEGAVVPEPQTFILFLFGMSSIVQCRWL